ncbi:hypothetical protein [Lysobacter sp. CA199]|uniref:hypothetical protein n=1 Tax=Lysobacter sp. CA199 TaxID=3455608 RepID=UPI003F8D352E
MNLSAAITRIGQFLAAHALRLLPPGGTAGQSIRKIDGTDYNVEWATPDAGGAQTIEAKALTDIPAGTLVRLTVELGDSATCARTNAPDPGGRTIGVGVLATAATAGNPVTVKLGVVYEDAGNLFYPGYPVYMRVDNTLTVNPVGTTPGVGMALTETRVILTNDVQRPGTIDFNAFNSDGSLTPVPESAIYLVYADSSNALRRIGAGIYQLTRPTELVLTAGGAAGGFGLPMFSDVAVILYDSAESTMIDGSAFAANKPVKIVQLGAGQVKIDGFNVRCKGNAITEAANAAIDVTPTQYGATVVTGDLAAADTGPYYTGLHENSASAFPFYGGTVDSGGITAAGTTILSARTRDTIPVVRAYVEFSGVLNGGGSIGFAKGAYFGGELAVDADSMALRVSADLADLEVRHNGAVIATIPGAGGLGSSVTRYGVLIDRVAGEFWLISGGAWLGPDPATDPGLPYFPGGDGGGSAWLALEARPGGGENRLFFLPSSLSWATEATAAGAVQLGWRAP